TRWPRDWSSDVCSSDLGSEAGNLRGESSWVVEDGRCRPSPATNVGAGSDISSGIPCTREDLDRTASETSPTDGGHDATVRACTRSEERRVGKERRSRSG